MIKAWLPLLLLFAIPATAAERQVDCHAQGSIGVATMTPDGTITLNIRSLPPDPIAEGVLSYKRGDRQYAQILSHIGGIAPGEYKPVPPWCD